MANASQVRDDVLRYDISPFDPISINLGTGYDVVEVVGAGRSTPQLRLSFTSAQVGNGDPNDANTMMNQDGGLAARMQQEDSSGALTGPVSRFDHEGINGNDLAIYNVSTDSADRVNLGGGFDTVNIGAAAGVSQVRLTFTSAEVGNSRATDSNTLANQDGGFAVRVQAENGSDGLTGPIGRFDDEGVTFVATAPGLTFDVRDLVSGAARGDGFRIVQLGQSNAEIIDRSAATESVYVNAGLGADRVTGGSASDFLVGGGQNDSLNGGGGTDSLLGGAGADRFVFTPGSGNDNVLDFASSGTDKIDLTAFDIDFGDVTIAMSGAATTAAVDTTGDGAADFTITPTNGAMPVASDFLL